MAAFIRSIRATACVVRWRPLTWLPGRRTGAAGAAREDDNARTRANPLKGCCSSMLLRRPDSATAL